MVKDEGIRSFAGSVTALRADYDGDKAPASAINPYRCIHYLPYLPTYA